ncbi:hypothetical protein CEQ90_01505 [Lewinellaceae bacterium SD302]|nr:hypothetical protein CEQ90_01505 [Lewinellaceae bacterium SD302]
MDSTYNHQEHLHRFACWTAARAAQRGWKRANTKSISDALESIEFSEKLLALFNAQPDSSTFDLWHAERAKELKRELLRQQLVEETISYGRLAKIIAIYIKTIYVSANPNSALARVAHPPIDVILLRNIKAHLKQESIGITYPVKLGFHWTKFDEKAYQQAVEFLRQVNGHQPFWAIEVFWKAS